MSQTKPYLEMVRFTIPDSVTSIGHDVFHGCSGLEEITLPFVGLKRGNTGTPDSLFGCIFGNVTNGYAVSGRLTCQYYASDACSTNYIPSNLRKVVVTGETILGRGAFQNCSGLTSVTISNCVKDVKAYAFSGCSGRRC